MDVSELGVQLNSSAHEDIIAGLDYLSSLLSQLEEVSATAPLRGKEEGIITDGGDGEGSEGQEDEGGDEGEEDSEEEQEEDDAEGEGGEQEVIEDDRMSISSDGEGDTLEGHSDHYKTAPVDDRDHLLFRFAASSPELTELFSIWDHAVRDKDTAVHHRVILVLSQCLLHLRGAVSIFAARKVIKSYLAILYTNMGSDAQKLVAASFKLLASIASINAPIARELRVKFNFAHKSFLKCSNSSDGANMKKGEADTTRKVYVAFILQLLKCSDESLVNDVLSTKNIIPSLFKTINQDDATTVTAILKSLSLHVIGNKRLGRLVKLNVFNVPSLEALVRLYSSTATLAIVHPFLLNLLGGDRTIFDAILNVHNVTANKDATQRVMAVLLALQPTGMLEHQELLLAILTKFPMLVKVYLVKFSCAFDPRPSFKWLANASFVMRVLHIPLPDTSLCSPSMVQTMIKSVADNRSEHGEGSEESQDESILDWISPQTLTKTLISKGLQHANKLVVYATLGLLCSILRRFSLLITSINATSEVEESVLQLKLNALRVSFTGRVPSIQTVTALISKHGPTEEGKFADDKDMLIYSRVVDVLCDYYTALPELITSTKFDLGKLGGKDISTLPVSVQYSVLKLFRINSTDLSRWLYTTSTKGVSAFSSLLSLVVASQDEYIKTAGIDLVLDLFKRSKIFDGAAFEASIWLTNLSPWSVSVLDTVLQVFLANPLKYTKSLATTALRRGTIEDEDYNILTISPLIVAAIDVVHSSPYLESHEVDAAFYLVLVCRDILFSVGSPKALGQLFHDVFSLYDDAKRGPCAIWVHRHVSLISEQFYGFNYGGLPTESIHEAATNPSKENAAVKALLKWKDADMKTLETTLFVLSPSTVNDHLVKLIPYYKSSIARGVEPLLRYFKIHSSVMLADYSSLAKVVSSLDIDAGVNTDVANLLSSISFDLMLSNSSLMLSLHDEKSKISVTVASHHLNRIIASCKSTNELHLYAVQIMQCMCTVLRQIDESIPLSSREMVVITSLFALLNAVAHRSNAVDSSVSNVAIAVLMSSSSVCNFFCKESTVADSICAIVTFQIASLIASLGNHCKDDNVRKLAVIAVEAAEHFIVASTSHSVPASHALLASLLVFPLAPDSSVTSLVKKLLTFVSKQAGSTPRGKKGSSPVDSKAASWASKLLIRILSKSTTRLSIDHTMIKDVLNVIISNPNEGGDGLLLDLVNKYALSDDAISDLFLSLGPAAFDYCYNRGTDTTVVILASLIRGSDMHYSMFVKELAALKKASEEKIMALTLPSLVAYQKSPPTIQEEVSLLYTNRLTSAVFGLGNHGAVTSKGIEPYMVDFLSLISSSIGKNEVDLSAWTSKVVACLSSTSMEFNVHRKRVLNILIDLHKDNKDQLKALLSTLLSKIEKGIKSKRVVVDGVVLLAETVVKVLHLDVAPTRAQLLSLYATLVVDGELDNCTLMNLLIELLVRIPPPGLDGHTVDTLVQQLIGHGHFVTTMFTRNEESSEDSVEEEVTSKNGRLKLLRLSIIRILLYFVLSNPGSVLKSCKHLFLSFLGSYSASLSPYDVAIRVLVDQFEKHEVATLKSVGYVWGKAAVARKDLPEDSLITLSMEGKCDWFYEDGISVEVLKRSVECYPLHICTTIKTPEKATVIEFTNREKRHQWGVLDPSYILPSIKYMILYSSVNIKTMITSGAMGYVVLALSSESEETRRMGYDVCARCMQLLDSAEFRETPQVKLVLRTLRDAITTPCARLPSIMGVFVAEALVIMLHPNHAQYDGLNGFLLSRSHIDLADVPMFYNLFNSGTSNYKTERVAALRMSLRGLQSDLDHAILVRRKVYTICTGFYNSPLADDYTRSYVLALIFRACALPKALEYLLSNAGILQWLFACIIAPHSSKVTVERCLTLLYNIWTVSSLHHLNVTREYVIGIPLLIKRVVSMEDYNGGDFVKIAIPLMLLINAVVTKVEGGLTFVVDSKRKHRHVSILIDGEDISKLVRRIDSITTMKPQSLKPSVHTHSDSDEAWAFTVDDVNILSELVNLDMAKLVDLSKRLLLSLFASPLLMEAAPSSFIDRAKWALIHLHKLPEYGDACEVSSSPQLSSLRSALSCTVISTRFFAHSLNFLRGNAPVAALIGSTPSLRGVFISASYKYSTSVHYQRFRPLVNGAILTLLPHSGKFKKFSKGSVDSCFSPLVDHMMDLDSGLRDDMSDQAVWAHSIANTVMRSYFDDSSPSLNCDHTASFLSNIVGSKHESCEHIVDAARSLSKTLSTL